MRKRKFAAGLECKQLLEVAGLKHFPATLSLNGEDDCLIYKSRILAVQGNRIVLAWPMPDLGECPMEPAAGTEIAVTFKKGYSKCLFVTRVIGPARFESADTPPSQAIAVYQPETIEKIPRRAYDRTAPPASEEIPVTFRQIAGSDREFHGILANISAGGIGVVVSLEDIPDLRENTQYEMRFTPLPQTLTDRSSESLSGSLQEPLTIRARFRHASEVSEGSVLLGFQLIGLELSEEGRNNLRRLARIVNIYQRQQPLSRHPNLIR